MHSDKVTVETKNTALMWLQKIRHESWVRAEEGYEFFNFLSDFAPARALKQKLKQRSCDCTCGRFLSLPAVSSDEHLSVLFL